MIEVKDYSNDIVYEHIKEFCVLNKINKNDLKNFSGYQLICKHILIDNNRRKSTSSFKIGEFNPLYEIFHSYFKKAYSFESRLIDIIEQHDLFFNNTRYFMHNKIYNRCYTVDYVYVIDLNNNIRNVIVFSFDELTQRNPYTLVLEMDDSNLLELESQVFEYYKTTFSISNLPEELQKPLSQMTADEKKLLSMIII